LQKQQDMCKKTTHIRELGASLTTKKTTRLKMPRKRPRIIVNDDRREKAAAAEKEMIKTSLIIVLSLVTNLLLFFNISFQTLIPTTMLIMVFLLSPFIGFVILKIKKISKPTLYSFAFSPLTLNTILLINYVFSFNPQKETYFLRQNTQRVYNRIDGYKPSTQTTTGVTLQDYAYDKYYGIRIFMDNESIKGRQITYTFKTGIFGIRVMTDYEFKAST